jgi:cytochrome P450
MRTLVLGDIGCADGNGAVCIAQDFESFVCDGHAALFHPDTCDVILAPPTGEVMQHKDAHMRCPLDAFDPFSAEYLTDPYALYAQAHAEQRVFYSAALGYWVLTGYDDIKRVLRDAVTYASRNATDPFTPITAETAAVFRAGGYAMQRVLLNADAPVHPRVRRQVAAAFTPQRIATLAPRIGALVERYIHDIIAVTGRQVDIVAALTYGLPAEVIFLLIGMDADDVPAIKAGSESRVLFTWGKPTDEQQVALAHDMVDFWQRAAAFVEKRRLAPQDDYTSDLIRLRNGDDAVLTMGEITSVVFGLLLAGHETTTGFLTNAIVRLLSDPTRWQTLAADPALIPAAVEELLRLDTSVIAMRRVTTAAVTLGGQEIPAGSNILALIGAANHDPEHFEAPGEYHPARTDAREHLSFGYGAHYCIGAPLARLEAQIVLQQLIAALPGAQLVPGQQLEYLPNTSFRGARSVLVRW